MQYSTDFLELPFPVHTVRNVPGDSLSLPLSSEAFYVDSTGERIKSALPPRLEVPAVRGDANPFEYLTALSDAWAYGGHTEEDTILLRVVFSDLSEGYVALTSTNSLKYLEKKCPSGTTE